MALHSSQSDSSLDTLYFSESSAYNYITALEEFVRAVLWSENYVANEGAVAWKPEDGDVYVEHNSRAERFREAMADLSALNKSLWDEVSAENTILYNGMHGYERKDVIDNAWKLLQERSLVRGIPNKHMTTEGYPYNLEGDNGE